MGEDHTLAADLPVAGIQRHIKDHLFDVGRVEGRGDTQQAPNPVEAHAGLEVALESVDDVRQVSCVEGACFGLYRQQYLLLAGRPAEVAVDVVVPRADVLQGPAAVKM